MGRFKEGGYGEGDLGSFDPIAAHLLDRIGLSKGDAREEALVAYDDYLASRGPNDAFQENPEVDMAIHILDAAGPEASGFGALSPDEE